MQLLAYDEYVMPSLRRAAGERTPISIRISKTRRRNLLNKFVVSLRGIRRRSGGFDSYLANVQSCKGYGRPTMDEARADFRSAVSSRYIGYLN